MRKVFFSFDYDDVGRAFVVRNNWVVKGTQTAAGFIDKADFEKTKSEGDWAIKKWIDEQLEGTSVTVVLVGKYTCNSRWVKYEIAKSIEKGNGILEIDISKIENFENRTTEKCGRMVGYEYDTYSWKEDNGYENIGNWIEKAARKADR